MNRLLLDFTNHTDDEYGDHSSTSTASAWGPAMGAALMVQLVTLSGLVIVAMSIVHRKLYAKNEDSRRFTRIIWTLQHLVVPSFATGALLATAVFLIIPEAISLLEGHIEDQSLLNETNTTSNTFEHEDEDEHVQNRENQVAWKFGAAYIGGFIFPILLGVFFPEPEILMAQLDAIAHEDETKNLTDEEQNNANICTQTNQTALSNKDIEDAGREVNADDDDNEAGLAMNAHTNDESNGRGSDDGKRTLASNEKTSVTTKTETTTEDGKAKSNSSTQVTRSIPSIVKRKNIPLAASILIGDFFHNLSDGFFIGSAFLLCSKSIGWTIVATTIYHEIAQELADYILLTTHCGLTVFQALSLNFLSGCSVMVGVVIILSVHLEDPAIGAILSVSAGVYTYIAAAECIPRVQAILHQSDIIHSQKIEYTLIFFVCFVLGAVPIGLVLLNHGHCEVHQ
jgi:zinc transporter ZupT